MNNFLRKHRAVIVWVVVVAFLVGGAALGFGMYLGGARVNNGQTASDTIATVGKVKISWEEYRARLSQYADQLSGLPAEQVLSYKFQILNSMIEANLLMQAAKKEKISVEVTAEDITAFIEDIKKNYNMTDQQINEVLSSQGMTMEQWRQEIIDGLKDQKTVEALMKKITGEITITDEDIKKSYEQVKVSTIYVAKGKDAEASKGKAEEALSKLQAGEDFVAVSKQYSEATNAAEGGDLGFINREYFDSETGLTEAAFSLEVGQTSELVETNAGYHIIKVTDKKVAEGKEFEDQKETIKADLLSAKETKIQTDWFQELKKKTKVVIKDPELAGYKALVVDNDNELAIKKFEEAVKRSNEDPSTLSYLALAYKTAGNVEKAIESYEKAIAGRPDNWEFYVSLGKIYQEQKNVDKAVEMYTQASANAVDDYFAHLQLKDAFTALGQKELADKETDIITKIVEKYEAEAAKAQEEQQQQTTENQE